jgi:protein-tyrosine phosphatase
VRSRSFDVVFICTGNRFRSAIAEALLARLTDGLPVAVGSAGTLDLGPVGVLPEALELAESLEIDLTRHRARCVRGLDLSEADLVLGFERSHAATAVVDCGARREVTFTLPELAALLGPVREPDGDLIRHARGAVIRANEARDRAGGRLHELADPLGGTPETFRWTAEEVRSLTETVAKSLFGVDSLASRAFARGERGGSARNGRR